MHYHVKVGLPASSFKEVTNWDELRERIRAEVDMVMYKYNDWEEFIFFLFAIYIVLAIWGI